MKELFIEQPSIDLLIGVKVKKDTEVHFENAKVEQVIKDLTLETILNDKGTNGFNSYESKSYIKIQLNEGDILLFDEERGYYLPKFPVTTVEEAIEAIESVKELRLEQEVEEKPE